MYSILNFHVPIGSDRHRQTNTSHLINVCFHSVIQFIYRNLQFVESIERYNDPLVFFKLVSLFFLFCGGPYLFDSILWDTPPREISPRHLSLSFLTKFLGTLYGTDPLSILSLRFDSTRSAESCIPEQ